MWPLFLCSCFAPEHKVHEHLVKAEEARLSARPAVYISAFVITAFVITSISRGLQNAVKH